MKSMTTLWSKNIYTASEQLIIVRYRLLEAETMKEVVKKIKENPKYRPSIFKDTALVVNIFANK